jgi:hypothetical protein
LATGHTALVSEILRTFGADERWRIWQNNTGTAFRKGRPISFGKKGSPDIIGFLDDGRFVGVEVKVGRDKQSRDQIMFAVTARKYNAVYLVARSLDDVAKFLASYK